MHAFEPWGRGFDTAGGPLFTYHLLRAGLAGFFALLLYGAGDLVLAHQPIAQAPVPGREKGVEAEWGTLDRILDRSFAGAAVLSLGSFALGLAGGYYRLPVIAGAAALVFLTLRRSLERFVTTDPPAAPAGPGPGSGAAPPRTRWPVRVVVWLVIVEALFLLITKATDLPVRRDGDSVVHYLPYLESVLAQHSLAKNHFFMHFFYSKGYGLLFFLALLGGLRVAAVVSFCFAVLAALLVATTVRRVADPLGIDGALAGAVAAALYLAAPLYVEAFDKPHVTSGVLIFYLATRIGRRLAGSSEPGVQRGDLLCTIATLVMSPPAFAFLLPLLLFGAAAAILLRRRAAATHLGRLLVAASLSFAAVIGFNYATTGLPEFTPAATMFRLRDETRLRRWIDPLAIEYQLTLDNDNYLVPSNLTAKTILDPGPMEDPQMARLGGLRPVLVAVALFGLLCLVARRREELRLLVPLAPIALLALLANLGFLLAPRLPSAHRYAMFLVPTRYILYVAGVSFVLGALRGRLARVRGVVSLTVLLALAAAAVDAFAGVVRAWPIDFFLGRHSHADALADGFPEAAACRWIQTKLPPHGRILTLNYLFGCYALPESRFEPSVMSHLIRDFGPILYGSPEESRRLLEQHGVEYFLVAIDGRPIIHFGFMSLFSRGNIERHLRVQAIGPEAYLFSWRHPGEPIEPEERVAFDRFLKVRDAQAELPWQPGGWTGFPHGYFFKRMRAYYEGRPFEFQPMDNTAARTAGP
ncbi:MAG: hypothetical protein NTY77_12845 [Elusimicrobia bacterium]|nr:hypothetical protein [Elusimicrobiota bacterium]